MARKSHRGPRSAGLSKPRYTRSELERLLGVPAEVTDALFPAPRQVSHRRGRAVPSWGADAVERQLRRPEVMAAVEKARQRASRAAQQARTREQQLAEAGEYLLSFGIDRMQREAAALRRRFVLHVGPTNSGKTWSAMQALRRAATGVYLGPLRLLALEMFDTLNRDGIPCDLLTGEESIRVPFARHTASTVELADFQAEYDVAVIDEAQMMGDATRGDRWMKAIYGIRAEEVHICLAPEALEMIRGMLESFGAPFTVVTHTRLAPLVFSGAFEDIRQARPGDALIVFSRKAVLAVAAELQTAGIRASVIYGALPPASRREEVRRFAAGETDVVVATDAIGMGVSLPIRRVIFCETEKFDGKRRRPLRTGEIKQVGGRAGRYGIYDRGEVLTMADTARVRTALTCQERQRRQMMMPFPREALEAPFPLEVLLTAWNLLPRQEGMSRVDMTDPLILLRAMGKLADRADRALVFDMITCPLDASDEGMVAYWLACCTAICHRQPLPEPPSGFGSLEQCEARYRELDIRHQMLRRIGVEEDRMAEKQELCEAINRFLQEDRESYLRTCRICGRRLPATYPFGLCERCARRR